MKKRSDLFRDRPRHPLQEAIWWCEYVLRHKGAQHLESQARSMTAPVLLMWDLVLVWLAIAIGTITLIVLGLKKIFYPKEVVQQRKMKMKRKKID